MMPAVESIREGLFAVLCLISCVFAVAGTIGLFRFPAVYSRLQASSLAGTTAVFTSFLAARVSSPTLSVGLRVVLVMARCSLSYPSSTPLLGRYAWRSGIDPWFPRSGG